MPVGNKSVSSEALHRTPLCFVAVFCCCCVGSTVVFVLLWIVVVVGSTVVFVLRLIVVVVGSTVCVCTAIVVVEGLSSVGELDCLINLVFCDYELLVIKFCELISQSFICYLSL